MNNTMFIPGRGLFGATDFDCLRVPVHGSASRVRLSLRDPAPEILNLQKITFCFEGTPVTIDASKCTFTQSSVYQGKTPELLLSGDGIHTVQENCPFWEVSFPEPVLVDEVRVFNRGDRWSIRSRSLAVEVWGADGSVRGLHTPRSADELLKAIYAGLGTVPHLAGALSRTELIAGLIAAAESEELDILTADWPMLVQLVDVWDGDAAISPDEIALLAVYLLVQQLQQQQRDAIHSLSLFSAVIKTRGHLRALEDRINQFAAVYGLTRYVLTRHGISPATLMEKAADYVEALHRVMGHMEALGYQPFICYGTLLGAARTNTFIPHDDDVDITYLLNASDLESVIEETAQVKAKLEAVGYSVGIIPGQLNMHVRTKAGLSIDLFPCWHENGKVQFFMERMVQRGIAPEIVFPLGRATLYSESFAAPCDIPGFLTERYGSGWSVSDQYYEWLWPLLDDSGGQPQSAPAISMRDIAPANQQRPNLRGHVDRRDSSMVCGWVIDLDDVATQFRVSILIDGIEVCSGIANEFREDLAANPAFGGTQHAFNIALPENLIDRKLREVTVVNADTRSVIGTPQKIVFEAPPQRIPGAVGGSPGSGESTGDRIQLNWWAQNPNFADLLSPWLIQKMTGKKVEFNTGDTSPTHLAIGTVIDKARPKTIVWGSGAYGCESSGQLCAEAEYRAVRGPLTRNALRIANIDCPEVYGDPALLVPRFYHPSVNKTHEVGIVLRWSEREWNQISFGAGVKKIFLGTEDIEGVLDEILACKRIVSSSLHGIILADAYGIPSAWIGSGTPTGLHFKYYDYFLSVNKVQRPQHLEPNGTTVSLLDLLANFDFDARRIEFDAEKLLKVCPMIDYVPA